MNARLEASRLLEAADRDLRTLRVMMNDVAAVPVENFGFLAQQAVEKSIKVLIVLRGSAYPFTHDLLTLTQVLKAAGEDIEALPDVAYLNDFAVLCRYEGLNVEDAELFDHQAVIHDMITYFDRANAAIGDDPEEEDDLDTPT